MSLNRDFSNERLPELPHNIRSAIHAGYAEVGAEKGIKKEAVYFSGSCEQVTSKVYEDLSLRYRDRLRLIEAGGGWHVTHHHFLALSDSGKWWIIDPTWQQFREEPDEKLPSVLYCKAENLTEALAALGIPAEKHSIWTSEMQRLAERTSTE